MVLGLSGGQTCSQSCQGLHVVLGMLQTTLGGAVESNSSAAGAEPKPGHPEYVWLLRTRPVAGNGLLAANGNPVCCGPRQQRDECRKQSPLASRGVSRLASVRTQFPKPIKHT